MTSRIVRTILSLVALALLAPAAMAQGTGRIVGRIIDEATGLGMTDVQIQVVGTTLGGLSGVEGRYTLPNIPEGTVSLLVRRIGYAPKTVTGIVVIAGKATEQNIAVSAANVQLQAVTVEASAERGTVAEALDAQRKAAGIINSITSEQIAKSPDGDAAQAVQRVSGVTVQDGKYVFVRGLGDRYTTSSLNGARIPSPEPEKKVVPLDLFPSSLLQSVTTSKTFTPDLPGDFSGASVDIKTKEFPANRVTTFSTSFGTGDAIMGRDLAFAPAANGDLFAAGGSARRVPQSALLLDDIDANPNAAQTNAIVNGFRNAWSARQRTGAGNGSAGFSVGGSDPVLGRDIGYLVSGTYGYSQETRTGLRRALALANTATDVAEVDRYDGDFGRSSVLWGGLANFSTMFGTNTRVSLNNTYNRTMDNDARREAGYSQNLQLPLDIERLRYVERSVRSSQLALTHEFTDAHRLEYSLTSSGVTRVEPDRSEIVYARNEADPTAAPVWLGGSTEAAVRTFGDLAENALEGRVDYKYTFGFGILPRYLKVGALARSVDRDADNRVYSLQSTALSTAERALRPEEIFGGQFTGEGESNFRVVPLAQGGSYRATDRLLAGYAMADYAVSERWSVIAGARVEQSVVQVDAFPTVGDAIRTRPTFTDVLPSLAVTLRLTESQNLRVAASQTLSRPEYRELAPIQFREVIGFDNVIGNASLVRTLVQNADIRWEWYPSNSEIVSVSLFGKQFQDPIERVYLGTSGTRIITFQNAPSATNYGVELELRKELGTVAPVLEPWSFFSNVTVMRSRIELDAQAASLTNADRPMVGQSPYVVNTGLTYTGSRSGVSATLLFNRVGRRIQDAGEQPLPDVYEESRNVMDLSLRVPLLDNVGLKLDAKNLLDAPYRFTQGPVVRETWRVGRIYSIGMTWRN
jgi:outer membrane receptor for ferrienterochelin and colicin